MSDYKAIVGKVKLIPVEGANTLQIAIYNGLTFAVGKDFTEDKLYLIFPPDGQLSEEYAAANDLIRRKNPETGAQEGGFFELNRKVRSISLMKGRIRSVGFIADLSSLNFTKGNINKLREGDEISEFNGVPICNKYINEATRRASRGPNQPKKKRDYSAIIGMDEHPDTKQFYRSQDLFLKGDLITVTLKLDGTSVRAANPYFKKNQTWLYKMASKFIDLNPYFNRVTTGTRRVVIVSNNKSETAYYGDHGMYHEFTNKIKDQILPGEAIYAEIVGWVDEQRPLFNRGGMIFKYGQPAGTREQYVYAIKHTMPNGYSYQLPWYQVKIRCKELGLKTVPELVPTFMYEGDFAVIERIANELTEGEDLIDKSHIREGIVFRIDRTELNETVFIKSKGAAFYALEDKSKSDDGFVDLEEAQSEAA